MKIDFLKKRNNFNKRKSSINPSLYWKLIILITFIAIVLASVFGYYLFTKINQETVLPTVSDTNQVGTVNKDLIEKVLNYFSEREQKSTQIINSPAPVVDPSL